MRAHRLVPGIGLALGISLLRCAPAPQRAPTYDASSGGDGGGTRACTPAGGGPGSYDWSLWPAPPDVPPDSQYAISADESTVTDRSTGLIWQRMVDDTFSFDGGGCSPSGAFTPCASLDEAAAYCESLDARGVGGCATGWRLPSLIELVSIMDFFGPPQPPFVNASAFPAVPPSPTGDVPTGTPIWYWSSTGGDDGGRRWGAQYTYSPPSMFLFGSNVEAPFPNTYSAPNLVRCVAGPLAPRSTAGAPARYTISVDGTVQDGVTDLTWQRNFAANQTDVANLSEATTFCAALALGAYSTGWRVPRIKELLSIVDLHGLAVSAAAAPDLYDETAFPVYGSDGGWLGGSALEKAGSSTVQLDTTDDNAGVVFIAGSGPGSVAGSIGLADPIFLFGGWWRCVHDA